MNIRRTASATLLAGGLLVLGSASPAAATVVCDAYSGNCTPAPPTQPIDVLPTTDDRDEAGGTTGGGGGSTTGGGGSTTGGVGSTTSNRVGEAATLPFTGGELVLLTAVGAGALAGGIALVAAGRRKPDVAA